MRISVADCLSHSYRDRSIENAPRESTHTVSTSFLSGSCYGARGSPTPRSSPSTTLGTDTRATNRLGRRLRLSARIGAGRTAPTSRNCSTVSTSNWPPSGDAEAPRHRAHVRRDRRRPPRLPPPRGVLRGVDDVRGDRLPDAVVRPAVRLGDGRTGRDGRRWRARDRALVRPAGRSAMDTCRGSSRLSKTSSAA